MADAGGGRPPQLTDAESEALRGLTAHWHADDLGLPDGAPVVHWPDRSGGIGLRPAPDGAPRFVVRTPRKRSRWSRPWGRR